MNAGDMYNGMKSEDERGFTPHLCVIAVMFECVL